MTAQKKIWKLIDRNSVPITSVIKKQNDIPIYDLYRFNYCRLKKQLNKKKENSSELIITFPNAQGILEPFILYESTTLNPILAQQFPEIQSFTGVSLLNKSTVITIAITLFGLHGMILDAKGTTLIEPYSTNLKYYIVYDKSQLQTTRDLDTIENTTKP